MKGPSVEILPGTVNNGMMQEPDFSEYMWMGEELDEFDQKVNAELERDFVEFCQNELTLEEEGYYCEQEEDSEWFYAEDYEKWKQDNPEGFDDDMQQQMMGDHGHGLNPDATEFVPRCIQPTGPHEQER